MFDQSARALLEGWGRAGEVRARAEFGESLGQGAGARRAHVESLPGLAGDEHLLLASQRFEITEQPSERNGTHGGGIHAGLGDASRAAARIGFVFAKHLRPTVAQLSKQSLDLMNGLWPLLQVGLKQATEVVIVETRKICGVLATGLVIEVGLKLDENVLSAKN